MAGQLEVRYAGRVLAGCDEWPDWQINALRTLSEFS
jgi:hypothetical protein